MHNKYYDDNFYKAYIASRIKLDGICPEDIVVPSNIAIGNFALPTYKFAKELKTSPVTIASNIANTYPKDNIICDATPVNAYVNFRIDYSTYTNNVLSRILQEGENYGSSDLGAGKTICIDYSSVNIASPSTSGISRRRSSAGRSTASSSSSAITRWVSTIWVTTAPSSASSSPPARQTW